MALYNPYSQTVGVSADSSNRAIVPTNINIVGNKKATLLPIRADLNSDVLTFIYNGTQHYHIDLPRTIMRMEVQIVVGEGKVIPPPCEVYTIP